MSAFLKKNLLLFTSCIFISGFVTAAPIPLAGGHRGILRTVQNPSLQLDALVVDVNSERRRVENKGEMVLVAGDLFTIIEGWLVDKSKSVAHINFVGLKKKVQQRVGDDRGLVIDTSRDLDPRLSVEGKGELYSIKVHGSGMIHGEVFVRLLKPALVLVEIEVNGQARTLKDGDKLSLLESDQLKVVRIQTNIRGNENVRHDLRQTMRNMSELRLKRGDLVFAKIPIEFSKQ